MPTAHPGFNRVNRPIAFDAKGNLFVALDASANLCTMQAQPPPGQPLPTTPPSGSHHALTSALALASGASRPTGRDRSFQPTESSGRRASVISILSTGHRPTVISTESCTAATTRIACGRISSVLPTTIALRTVHRILRKADGFRLALHVFDGARDIRLIAPEYGGDGKQTPPAGKYSSPVLTFHSRRPAPVDLLFYSRYGVPARYRGGAFVVLHGTQNKNGYDVVFVPFDRNGKAGSPAVFADGFAGFDRTSANRAPAAYRPIGIGEGPDGAISSPTRKKAGFGGLRIKRNRSGKRDRIQRATADVVISVCRPSHRTIRIILARTGSHESSTRNRCPVISHSPNPMPRSALSFAFFASSRKVLHRCQRSPTCA